MSNFTDFFPAAGGGGGGFSLSNMFQVIGTGSDVSSTFSPSTYDLEVGSKIFVVLIGGGQGGQSAAHNGSGYNHGILHGAPGSYYQGIYTLTSTADITCLAGAGGAGDASSASASQQAFKSAVGTLGNVSTLTQNSSVIISSDNTTLLGYGLPLDGDSSARSLQFLAQDTNSVSSVHWSSSAIVRTIEKGVDGTGSGGQGEHWNSYAAGARTATTPRGKGGLVLIQWT